MVASTYPAAMKRVFADEGGYSDDRGDPAGCTMYGIIRPDLGPHATCVQIRAITIPQAQDIYDRKYAAPMCYNDLPAGVDYSVLDYAINSGISRSGRVLRHLVGIAGNDWHVTPEVIAAVKKRDPNQLIDAIWSERVTFLHSLRTWPLFGGGWGRRCATGKVASHAFAALQAAPPEASEPTHGKAQHPEPTVTKNVVKTGGVVGAGGFAYLADWIGAHPMLSAGIMVATIAGIILLVDTINKWHQQRQVTPMPGTPVVPEMGVAT